ncbi:MAG: patatin-like phospholipase family protein [Burkholderiaceae bacterium]
MSKTSINSETPAKEKKPRTVSLVLGSGGAKGLTHIGVIRCLIDQGFSIRSVAGSSMGALIGGIYAAEKLDVYADWVKALERSDVVRLLDWSFGGGGLFKGERIISELKVLIGDRNIEQLPVRFTAVATDLSVPGPGREVWFNHGPLFDAIRASMAVPTIFTPVAINGRLLVDGAVINPVPVAPTLSDQTDLIIAVDLNGPIITPSPLSPERQPPAESALLNAYRDGIGRFMEMLSLGAPDSEQRLGFSDIAMRSMEAMQATITQFKNAANPPSLTVSIPRNLCTFFDFFRASELIDFGYKQAQEALARLDKNPAP